MSLLSVNTELCLCEALSSVLWICYSVPAGTLTPRCGLHTGSPCQPFLCQPFTWQPFTCQPSTISTAAESADQAHACPAELVLSVSLLSVHYSLISLALCPIRQQKISEPSRSPSALLHSRITAECTQALEWWVLGGAYTTIDESL